MEVRPSHWEMNSKRHSYVSSVSELLHEARKEAKGTEARQLKEIASGLTKNLVTSIVSPRGRLEPLETQASMFHERRRTSLAMQTPESALQKQMSFFGRDKTPIQRKGAQDYEKAKPEGL